MNLSAAARAVCLPVLTTNGPSAAMRPSRRKTASSYSAPLGQVPVDALQVREPVVLEPEDAGREAGFVHAGVAMSR